MFIAAERGHGYIVKILLVNGAKKDPVNKQGITPLCAAAKEGHIEVVKILLDAGANKVYSQNGISPLVCAADAGHAEVASLLTVKDTNGPFCVDV